MSIIKFKPLGDLKFQSVEVDQFFVDHTGRLCQKFSPNEYNVIADDKGNPLSLRGEFTPGELIQRIIPQITEIEF